MTKDSKPAVEVLSDLMQRSLSKDPVLAAKQARLLEKLRNDPSSPLRAASPPQPTETSSKALLDELEKVPEIKRGTVEESMMRWLESQVPTSDGTKFDLVKLWNLPPSSDAHKNPRPLVDSDIFLAAQEMGWATPERAPVLWESQRFKVRCSQMPFYAVRVAERGARVWIELSRSYRGAV